MTMSTAPVQLLVKPMNDNNNIQPMMQPMMHNESTKPPPPPTTTTTTLSLPTEEQTKQIQNLHKFHIKGFWMWMGTGVR